MHWFSIAHKINDYVYFSWTKTEKNNNFFHQKLIKINVIMPAITNDLKPEPQFKWDCWHGSQTSTHIVDKAKSVHKIHNIISIYGVYWIA